MSGTFGFGPTIEEQERADYIGDLLAMIRKLEATLAERDAALLHAEDTVAAVTAERDRLAKAGDAVCQRFEAAVTWFEPATHDFYLGVVADWRALTRGEGDSDGA